ncbi:hypothetical protein [Paludibacterium paludis]|uniref:Uncharacterized protein n=1 Tax=Paludibacterium paludis TaxID=1225769 RepID=A0A918P6K3_9NEIS|nr:hypothetical protein [Paludibacterium paludis]GGY26634.1 hypothetical protein GCM10011289_32740 [Paludibacterium paludis]
MPSPRTGSIPVDIPHALLAAGAARLYASGRAPFETATPPTAIREALDKAQSSLYRRSQVALDELSRLEERSGGDIASLRQAIIRRADARLQAIGDEALRAFGKAACSDLLDCLNLLKAALRS